MSYVRLLLADPDHVGLFRKMFEAAGYAILYPMSIGRHKQSANDLCNPAPSVVVIDSCFDGSVAATVHLVSELRPQLYKVPIIVLERYFMRDEKSLFIAAGATCCVNGRIEEGYSVSVMARRAVDSLRSAYAEPTWAREIKE